MRHITQILCFNCAYISPDTEDAEIICPKCGFTTERDSYQKIIQYAAEVVEFGYHYRLTYERDLDEGKLDAPNVRIRYALSIEVIWVFVALAALSGVIGNATWDFIKAVIKEIINSQTETNNRTRYESISRMLENEERFGTFIQYIQEYHRKGINALHPKVAEAVAEEMIVDEAVSLFPYDRNGMLVPLSQEELVDIYKRALAIKVASKKMPEENELAGFWKGVPNDSSNMNKLANTEWARSRKLPSKANRTASKKSLKKKSSKRKRSKS